MTDLFLAVDGGQTGTVAVLAAADGSILAVGRGGPIRHHDEPDAVRFVRDGVGCAIAEAMSGAGDPGKVAVCCLAMTGSSGVADQIARDTVQADDYVVLESDTFAALASGTGGGGGIALIAGTGTVSLALSRGGESILLGGWGWLLGDEGGGFWIAMEALKASARAVDGTGRRTNLADRLPSLLGQHDLRGVYNIVTGQRLDRTAIAALATTVVEAAESGDEVAADILNRAADHLAELVIATIGAAPFLHADERVVVACGGVLRAGGWVLGRLQATIADRIPDTRLVVPQVPPVIGAYYLALARHGVVVDAALMGRVEAQVDMLHQLNSKTSISQRQLKKLHEGETQ